MYKKIESELNAATTIIARGSQDCVAATIAQAAAIAHAAHGHEGADPVIDIACPTVITWDDIHGLWASFMSDCVTV